MNYELTTMRSLRIALALGLVLLCSPFLYGQEKAEKAEYKAKYREFCSNNNWSNSDKVLFSEVREMRLPESGSLNIDGGRNGGIQVKGENRSDVLIRACIQTWGASDEAAKAIAANLKIGTNGVVKADGDSDTNWSVSYEARVPRSTNLSLKAHNGGISIGSVEGILEFETTNGGVNVSDAAGDVKGRTTNGGVNVSLSGSSWKGNGLDVVTTNGGVNLSMPENYAANVETGTINGGFRSDIASLNVERTEKTRSMKFNAPINGGGPPIRVITTNGGIKINAAERRP